ncbi:uncharacterized protein LOC108734799 [Agrilus planipennis]|uniref:Uncharacterized protein LOC108734799 n=1 Tax=Agrilus planipennis TaxID=224129 RepID=A0A1W4WPL3_AGRPL|nr:uncharacterized protein LOC108734799 [Agrilus planipennis]
MNNFQLIKEVAARRLLWDKSDLECEVNDVSKREELWDEIAAKLRAPKQVARTRWKNLRDSYRRLIVKQYETGEEPKWRYFKMMSFLKDAVMSTKPRTLDVSLMSKMAQSSSFGNMLKTEPSEDEYVSFSDINVVDSEETSNLETLLRSCRKKRPSDDCEPEYIEVQGSIENENHIKVMRLSSNDEDLQFLLSLHSHLKKVPPHKKLIVRMKLEKIFYEELYSDQIIEDQEVNNEKDS